MPSVTIPLPNRIAGQDNVLEAQDSSGNILRLTATSGALIPTLNGVGGSGGSVTQITNRSTGVTLNKMCGVITTDTTSLAGLASADFVVTNSKVAIGDAVAVSIRSGSNGGGTIVSVSTVAAGSFTIRVSNNNAAAGTAETGAILINFVVIKAGGN